MSFDNRVFDVNGETQEELRLAFRLAFAQEGRNTKAKFKYDMPRKHWNAQ